jgi:hypothetical protein
MGETAQNKCWTDDPTLENFSTALMYQRIQRIVNRNPDRGFLL